MEFIDILFYGELYFLEPSEKLIFFVENVHKFAPVGTLIIFQAEKFTQLVVPFITVCYR